VTNILAVAGLTVDPSSKMHMDRMVPTEGYRTGRFHNLPVLDLGIYIYGNGSKPGTPGEHQNSW